MKVDIDIGGLSRTLERDGICIVEGYRTAAWSDNICTQIESLLDSGALTEVSGLL